MKRPRPGVGSELLPILLILIGLAGTLGLVVSMHRKAATARALASKAKTTVVATAPPPPAPEAVKPPAPKPAPPPPAPPAVDPTKAALARVAADSDEQLRAIREADRRAAALETAAKAALAQSQQRRRREALVKAQIDGLDKQARDLEVEADALAAQRDVLARERDATKAALAKAVAHGGGYAVLPHKGPNGTWQRPVVVECRDGTAILQPKGQSFSILDLSAGLGTRSSPLVMAVGRELIRAYRTTSPDGGSVVPYIYFIVRPDGIRPYYEARARLEPLGIAFGYELVDQDTEIDFPDFDELDSWDGTGVPRKKDAPPSEGSGALAKGNDFIWPVDRPDGGRGRRQSQGGGGGGRAGGDGKGDGDGDGPEKFLWPTGPSGTAGNDSGGDGDLAAGSSGPAPRGLTPGRGLTGAGPGGAPPRLDQIHPERIIRNGLAAIGDESDLRAPGGSRSGAGVGRGGAGHGPATEVNGFVPVNPDDLPGLDRLGGLGNGLTAGPRGAGEGGLASAPGGAPGLPPVPNRVTPSPGDGVGGAGGRQPTRELLELSEGRRTGSFNPPLPPGRVRIDPAMLAQNDDPFGDADSLLGGVPPLPGDPDQGGAGQPGEAGSASRASGKETGRSGPKGSGAPAASGASPPQGATTGGLGRPSPSGAQNGTLGLGLPSLGTSSGPRNGDIRPKVSTSPAWPPSRTTTIELPLELVVACRSDGVMIHPGGYRLSLAALRKQGTLARDLETIVVNHALIDASVRPRPRIQFLIEPGGNEAYQEARRQTVLAGFNWPVTLQVAGPQAPSVFPKERF